MKFKLDDIQLKNEFLKLIHVAAGKFPEIESIKLFGSRAVGTAKDGSDIDIVLFGNSVQRDTMLKLKDYLENEVNIPHFFDIVIYDQISHDNLKSHIDSFGKTIYTKK